MAIKFCQSLGHSLYRSSTVGSCKGVKTERSRNVSRGWQQFSDLSRHQSKLHEAVTSKNKSQALKGKRENEDVGLRTNKLLSYETTGKRKGLKSFSLQKVWIVSTKIILFSVMYMSL